MQFDYYAATLPAAVSHCHQSIINQFNGSLISEKPIKPYTHGVRHSEGGFRVYHGGVNPHPFFVASGLEAQRGAEFIRRVYPSHRVARADVAQDFCSPGGFDQVVRILDPIARAAGVSVTFIGDPAPGQTSGRSIYYGSPKSDVRIVVYEKGWQLLGNGVTGISPDWFRVELRARPRKDRKSLTAGLEAAELWGLSQWTKKAAEAVLGVAPVYRPDPSCFRVSSADQAVAAMLRQYGRAIRAFADQHGREALDELISACLDGE